jgi:hypothetical protein
MKKFPIRFDESMNTVLAQELIRFNGLIDAVRSSLAGLRKVCTVHTYIHMYMCMNIHIRSLLAGLRKVCTVHTHVRVHLCIHTQLAGWFLQRV